MFVTMVSVQEMRLLENERCRDNGRTELGSEWRLGEETLGFSEAKMYKLCIGYST